MLFKFHVKCNTMFSFSKSHNTTIKPNSITICWEVCLVIRQNFWCTGKDAASPRYIFTSLNKITRSIFIKEDDFILNYLNDDG